MKFLALFLCLLTVSCTSNKDKPFVLAFAGESASLDPHSSTADPYMGFILAPAYDGLVRLNADGSFSARLAQSWSNPSPLEWRFSLRSNVFFHDDTLFTIEDALSSFERIKKNPSTAFLLSMVENITNDGSTIIFKLSRPYSAFLYNIAHPNAVILSKNFLENGGDPAKTMIGTGPYFLESYTSGQDYVYKAYPKYYGSPPEIKNIIYKTIPDPSVRLIALETKEADAAYILGADWDTIQKNAHLKLYTYPAPRTEFLGFNYKSRKEFSNIRLRQALNIAIDRKGVVNAALIGAGKEAYSLLSPVVPYAIGPLSTEANIKDAAFLIKQLQLVNNKFTLTVPEGFRSKVAEILQASFKEIGLDITIETLSYPAFITALSKGQIEMYIFGRTAVTMDADNLLYPLLHSTSSATAGNTMNYKNTQLDTLLEEARSASAETRGAFYGRIQNFLMEELPVIPIYYPIVSIALNTRYSNLTFNAALTPNFEEIKKTRP